MRGEAAKIAAALDVLEGERGFLRLSWRTRLQALAGPVGEEVFASWARDTALALGADHPALVHAPPKALWFAFLEAAEEVGGLDALTVAALRARIGAAFPGSL